MYFTLCSQSTFVHISVYIQMHFVIYLLLVSHSNNLAVNDPTSSCSFNNYHFNIKAIFLSRLAAATSKRSSTTIRGEDSISSKVIRVQTKGFVELSSWTFWRIKNVIKSLGKIVFLIERSCFLNK